MVTDLNLDGLGWLYISIITIWTAILLAGVVFLIFKRHAAYLRMRNIPLAISAVLTLHIYWILCVAAYALQGYYPCAAEYWIMSIYLPLGIALFQVCNTQLLHIADLQQRYASDQPLSTQGFRSSKGLRSWLIQANVRNKVNKTMGFITYGMVIQVRATVDVGIIM